MATMHTVAQSVERTAQLAAYTRTMRFCEQIETDKHTKERVESGLENSHRHSTNNTAKGVRRNRWSERERKRKGVHTFLPLFGYRRLNGLLRLSALTLLGAPLLLLFRNPRPRRPLYPPFPPRPRLRLRCGEADLLELNPRFPPRPRPLPLPLPRPRFFLLAAITSSSDWSSADMSISICSCRTIMS